VFPRHLEQLWNATTLEVLGVGVMLRTSAEAPDVASAMRRLTQQHSHAEAAGKWAAEIAHRGHGDPVGAIAGRCEAVLTGSVDWRA
jgi:UDP:flavonoid glycosyltransferase YjiC (YdhE family)